MVNRNLLYGHIVSAGFTQKSLAEAVKMSENSFSSSMNGKRSFSTDEVIAICEKLGIDDSEVKCKIFLV